MSLGRRVLRKLSPVLTTAAMAATAIVFVTPGTAAADPSSGAWLALRQCESGNRYNINTGNGYYGAYQFDLSTWRSVGGTGYPHQASAAEQDYRALYLYRMRGWAPWICAALAGLSEDRDGGSGKAPARSGAARVGRPAVLRRVVRRFLRIELSTEVPRQAVPRGRLLREPQGLAEADGQARLRTHRHRLLRRQDRGRGPGVAEEGQAERRRLHRAEDLGRRVEPGQQEGLDRQAGSTQADHGEPATPYVPATNASCSVGAKKAPAFKGATMKSGSTYRELQCFQRQLGHRGYGLTGTGYFGAKTKAAVQKLQRKNGISNGGVVDAATWKAAWQGK